MPRSRSRSGEPAPATRAAQAVRTPRPASRRGGALSVWVKLGQFVVFGGALALLGLYTVSDQLARDEGFHVKITWVSVALLGIAAFVVVLPRIVRPSPPSGGSDADLAVSAHDAALTAAAVAPAQEIPAARGRALLAVEPSAALAQAAHDPMTSIELSRRALAVELRRFTTVAGITTPTLSLARAADEVHAAGFLRVSEARAIGELSAVIDAAKAAGSASAGVAQDVDYATQLLVLLLDQRFDLTARRPTAPPVDYEEIEPIEVEDAPAVAEVPEGAGNAGAVAGARDLGELEEDEIDLRDHAGDETDHDARRPVAWRAAADDLPG